MAKVESVFLWYIREDSQDFKYSESISIMGLTELLPMAQKKTLDLLG